MRAALLCAFVLLSASLPVNGRHSRIKQGKETWGYVNVRPGAHTFFWLYYTTADVEYETRPLVLWLQGGPGASSTGIGNFLEIGPKDTQLNNRTNAWTDHVNILFVDNPVGTGYSYVDDPKFLTQNNSAIATDLVDFMKGFFKKVPEFQNVPLYIFAESYGGKMAVQFAQYLNRAVQQKQVTCQLAGIALGDSWVSPVDSVLSWGPYLYSMSLVDSVGLKQINTKTQAVAQAVKSGKMADATKLWSEAEDLIENVTNGVNFYNILSHPDKDGGEESNHVREHAPPTHYIDRRPKKTKSWEKSRESRKKEGERHRNHIHRRSPRKEERERKEEHDNTHRKSDHKDSAEHNHISPEKGRSHHATTHTVKHEKERRRDHKHKKHHNKPHFSLPHYLELLYDRHVGSISSDLDKLMNGPIRDKLKVIPQNVTWGGQSQQVFAALAKDFMNPVVMNVEALLNTSTMTIAVYNGQLDLIVDTPGVQTWVERLRWAGTPEWVKASRKAIESSPGVTQAFSKSFKNFHFYWILQAGHMVPADAGEVAIKMLKEIVGLKK